MRSQNSQDEDPFKDLKENPALSDVVEANIRTLLRIRHDRARERTLQDKLADGITFLSGRMAFVYLHIIWFAMWILLNTGRFGFEIFDPFPYGLLTMIVSLEAIFLSTFVLISQNRTSEEAERRADLDLHVGMLDEAKMTFALRMLDQIQQKLGIENRDDAALKDLLLTTSPKDLLEEIARLQNLRKGMVG